MLSLNKKTQLPLSLLEESETNPFDEVSYRTGPVTEKGLKNSDLVDRYLRLTPYYQENIGTSLCVHGLLRSTK